MTRNQARGYLYEVVIAHLLEKNSFLRCTQKNHINKKYKCGVSSKDGEVLGRGTHHQIDFVGIYEKHIPFIFPIRLLAECKFWTDKDNDGNELYKVVSKSFIREYVGVSRDISENYFSLHMKKYTRFLDVPIIFSAGGFHEEAEKLAWAQGINIVSHSKLPIMQDVLKFIETITSIIPDNYLTDKEKFKELKEYIDKLINHEIDRSEYEEISNKIFEYFEDYEDNEEKIDSFVRLLQDIRDSKYNTFLFATTNNGKLINLISYDEFPDELFINENTRECGIFFETPEDENRQDRVFYITIYGDEGKRFYFQANEEMMLEDFSERSEEDRINTKERYFKELSIIKEIDGLTRLITLKVNFEPIINRGQ